MAAYPRANAIAPLLRVAVTSFLAVAITGAIFLTANLYVVAGGAKRAQYAALADVCAERIRTGGGDAAATQQAVRGLYRQFRIEGVMVADGGRVFTAGNVDSKAVMYHEERSVGGRTVQIRFTDHELVKLVRIGRIVLAVGAAATIGGIVMLFTALFSAIGSREPAGGAGGGTVANGPGYLIDTFETSVRTLRGRENVLKEMHTREKERADALETITETLVRSLTSGFISVDDRGLLLDMNQAAREILDVPAATFPVRDLLLPEALGATDFTRVLQEAIDGRASLQRVEIAQADRRTIGLSTVPLLDPARRYLGMLALFTDLTPVRQLETRLRDMQSLADLGEMSAGIAHEFRNSLSTVLGYLHLALKSNVPPEADERIRNAEREALLLTEAVESLLTFARPMDLQTRSLDVTDLLSEVAERLRPLNGAIAIEVAGGPLVIEGDAVLLSRAFENLIRNATESIQERGGEGHIDITVSPTQRSVNIADDGMGIDETEASRLFLPFRSTKPNGFGLGLALTRKIVILHGGTISLSGRRGEGATVAIALPPPAW